MSIMSDVLEAKAPGAIEHSREAQSKPSPKIAIIDDEPIILEAMRCHLEVEGYDRFVLTSDPRNAFDTIVAESPDVVLLDIMMPEVSGLDILERIRGDARLAHLPVIILTAASNIETRVKSLNLGATDFLEKPVHPVELLPRVRNALVLKAHHDHLQSHTEELERQVALRTAELKLAQCEIIRCLARASEYRDNETGKHVIRVGHYAAIIANQLGLDDDYVDQIGQAAQLHDIGKIAIPDAILRKPGKLTDEEFDEMRKHTVIGEKVFEPVTESDLRLYRSKADSGPSNLLSEASSPILKLAAEIALTHHERWDGRGYPSKLKGEEIPISGRITAVADVFDALSNKRPYKEAFPLDECLRIMIAERGKHFDPEVLDAFFESREEVVRVQLEYHEHA